MPVSSRRAGPSLRLMTHANTANRAVSPAVARIAPFAVFMAFIALSEPLGHALQASGVDPRWIFAARALAVAAILAALWKAYVELEGYATLTFKEFFLAVTSGVAVFVMWINLDFSWATVGEPSQFSPTGNDGRIDWTLVAFRLIGLALVVPLMEELFWRSFLMRWIQYPDFLGLNPRKVRPRALLICSVLFATEHNLWFAGLLAGLVYGALYIRSGNLWVPVISHTVTNGVLGIWILASGNWQFW